MESQMMKRRCPRGESMMFKRRCSKEELSSKGREGLHQGQLRQQKAQYPGPKTLLGDFRNVSVLMYFKIRRKK